jgi:hypothetical protein
LHRDTCEDTAEDCPDGVADDYSEDTPAGDLELPGWEHSVVLQKDRTLCQSEGKVVSD